MLGPYKIASPKYKYSAYDAAFYSAFSPIAVGVFISWIIIASNCGETGNFYNIIFFEVLLFTLILLCNFMI